MSSPLVSVIVTTYNNTETLDACLASIAAQTYKNIELIVVDNNSTDDTKAIAAKFTEHVFNKGPERCTQRNYGVQQANGRYVMIIDSDMELDADVITDCVAQIAADPKLKALVIPEESFGNGFWARCKQLERSFYVGVNWMEAARFFDKATYQKLGGYNENLVSGEDWDLSQRAREIAPIGRIPSYIRHNEGRLKLGRTLQKKYYYSQKFAEYLAANGDTESTRQQTGLAARYGLFFSHPDKLLAKPHIGIGMLFMKTCEFAWGGCGYIRARMRRA
jgi:glycosyltransferase involved in cell wall biosynthesis